MALSEFDLINRYFRRGAARRGDVLQGIGDDGAVVLTPPGQDLVVSMDTLVEGIHFPVETNAEDIGYKALAVNLSDMAAMGAEPAWFTLSLTLPEVDLDWLEGFSTGLFCLADEFSVELIGGDTSRGPLSITVAVHGLVPHGGALYRHGARAGDFIYVTGELGDAGLALRAMQHALELPPQVYAAALARLNRPRPRVREGGALRDIAHAAVDISDGLLSDLGHILHASGVGASVDVGAVPVTPWLHGNIAGTTGDNRNWWDLVLGAGDDYELCFTAARERQQALETALSRLSCPCTRIGVIETAPGLRCRFRDGREYEAPPGGYDHFTNVR